MIRSSNPALSTGAFVGYGTSSDAMSVSGTVVKTGILLLTALLSAGFVWKMHPLAAAPWMMAGIIGGLIAAVATVAKKEWAPVTAPLYALFEGLFIGGASAVFEAQAPGIVGQAASLTFATLFAMLFAYQSGLVRATEKFKLGVAAATGGIALVYLFAMLFSFFGYYPSMIYGGGVMGIGWSLFVVAIAAFNLVIDFDFIERGASLRAPKYLEWYGAFALMVTVIWLYIEFLRLLSKARQK